MPGNDVFPLLQSCSKLESGYRVYDVKFYPYATIDDDQIFAAVAETDTFVCRPLLGQEPPFEVLRWFQDEQTHASYNSLVWTIHPTTRNPLLCVAGLRPKHIKILDIESGQCIRILTGHGKGINDLAISPLSTNLLASCAEDDTIRLWNLKDDYANQPCVALFGGEGHKSPILAIRFHPNGKWLLSGGIDTAVCLWAVPSLDELDAHRTKESRQYPQPLTVYYPHFFSTEVHSNYVDCFDFYGDYIFSRAAKDQIDKNKANDIILWRIEGFNSHDPAPAEPPIPTPDQHTRSCFPHPNGYRGFRRVLTFSMPNTDRFYHRFALLHQPGMRPILAMGNQMSKYFFWDLQRLEEGVDPRDDPGAKKGRARKVRPGVPSGEGLGRLSEMRRSQSIASGTPGLEASEPSEASGIPADRVYTLDDGFKSLAPHHSKIANTKLSEERHFGTSQMSWSPDGTWLVGTGDFGMISIFHRDRSVV